MNLNNKLSFIVLITFVLSIQRIFSYPDLSFSSLDKSNLDVNYYFNQPCRCVKLGDCKNMITMATKSQVSDRNYLYDIITKASCGYIDDHPLVCCPSVPNNPDESYSIEIEDEPPWVWDSVKLNENQSSQGKKKVSRKFNYFQEYESYEHNLVDFEDPHTRKNCPPMFYDGFDDDVDITGKRKPIQPTFKPFYPRDYHRYHGIYNYPPPRRFKFAKLEPTTELPPNHRPTTELPPNHRPISDSKNPSLLNNDYCGISVNTRIVGGRESGPGQFPWIARIAYRNKTSKKLSYRCAGSIINDRYILTAAHCVTNLIDELQISHVRIGDVEGKRKRNCASDPVLCRVPQDYNVEKVIAHPAYDTPKYANDIALIRIFKPDASVSLTPICLPFNNIFSRDEQLVGRQAIIAGWSSNVGGVNDPTPDVSNRKPTLQYVRLPIVNRTECAVTYARFSANSWTPISIQTSQICAQGRENMDACQGDSGGPLMDDGTIDKTYRYTILGLVSFGPRTCGVSNFPGVYTRIASFMDWILANVQP